MRSRTLRTIVGSLGALVVLYALVSLLGRGFASPGSGGSGEVADFLGGLEATAFDAVEFRNRQGTVRLARSGAEWSANRQLADSSMVAAFLDQVAGATVLDIVATNPTNHERLGITEDSALVVVFEAGGSADTLLLGSVGPSFDRAYARLPGQDDVYLVRADLRAAAGRDADDWRSRRILALDTAAVRAVDVVREGEAYRLARVESGWTLDGQAVDAPAARTILSEAADLEAAGFSARSDAPSGDPVRTITFQGPGGAMLARVDLWEAQADSADAGSGLLLVRAEGREPLFELAAWRADRLVPDRSALVGDGGPGGQGLPEPAGPPGEGGPTGEGGVPDA